MPHGIANDVSSGLSQEYLRDVLHYDRETGTFTWKKNTGKKRLVGKVAGSKSEDYWEIGLLGRRYKAHRLAWFYVHGVWPQSDIDHINLDKLDNRFDNFREATRAQNNINTHPVTKSSSVRRGVCWHSQASKWRAYITVRSRQISLGLFDDVTEAVATRVAAESKYYGEYARKN